MHNPSMFDWNDLRYMLAVAQHGSTLAAAKALGVNQSTVQRRLSELERKMGQRLFVRHATGYKLTEIGELLIPVVQTVERAIHDVYRQSEALKRDMTGVIRLTCPEPIVSRIVEAELLDRFHALHPEIRVEFVTSDSYLDISAGEADVAFRSGEPTDPRLVGRKIAASTWTVYASKSYSQRSGRPATYSDLNDHTLIGFDGIMENHRASKWLANVAPEARYAAHSQSVLGLLDAAKSGLGLAPLPTALGDAESNLERIFSPIEELERGWYILAASDLRRSPRIAAFFDFIVSELAALRPILTG